jgi:hypothetical protein
VIRYLGASAHSFIHKASLASPMVHGHVGRTIHLEASKLIRISCHLFPTFELLVTPTSSFLGQDFISLYPKFIAYSYNRHKGGLHFHNFILYIIRVPPLKKRRIRSEKSLGLGSYFITAICPSEWIKASLAVHHFQGLIITKGLERCWKTRQRGKQPIIISALEI